MSHEVQSLFNGKRTVSALKNMSQGDSKAPFRYGHIIPQILEVNRRKLVRLHVFCAGEASEVTSTAAYRGSHGHFPAQRYRISQL